MKKTTIKLSMKPIFHYDYFVLAGFAIFIAENIYFGWNKTPQSAAETFFDIVSSVLMVYGVLGGIAVGFMRRVFYSIIIEQKKTCEHQPTLLEEAKRILNGEQ